MHPVNLMHFRNATYDLGAVMFRTYTYALCFSVCDLPLLETASPMQVCPKDPDLITLKELVTCGLGHSICGILTDFDAFYFYETNFHVDKERAELG